MSDSAQPDWGLFQGGPPIGIQRWLGLVPPGPVRAGNRIVLAILVAWLPLLLLAAVQDWSGNTGVLRSFLFDFSIHARMLVAVPLLILAEAVCTPRLGGIVHHFLETGMVQDKDRPRFDAALDSTVRLRDSAFAEMLVVVLAYGCVVMLHVSISRDELPGWYSATQTGFAWAGWWHGFVSNPLLLVLLIGWIWRLFLWTRLLALIANLDLRLVPAHPDRAAGLKFVGYSLRAFSILGIVLGTLVAGTVANGVVHEGMQLSSYAYAIAGVVGLSLIVFCGPMLFFARTLLHEWQRGIFQYGALADSLGREFEHKWFDGRRIDEAALDAQDFSAATDLYQVVGNVYDMKVLPMDLKSVVFLAMATLLPFVPVVVLALPMETIFSALADVLL